MKLQIDTKEKTIKVEENVNIEDFLKTIKQLFPNEWKEFTLETNTVINYSPWITWDYNNPSLTIAEPCPWYSYISKDTGYSLTEGIYNVNVIL